MDSPTFLGVDGREVMGKGLLETATGGVVAGAEGEEEVEGGERGRRGDEKKAEAKGDMKEGTKEDGALITLPNGHVRRIKQMGSYRTGFHVNANGRETGAPSRTGRNMTRGEFGCFLSHYQIWEDMVSDTGGEGWVRVYECASVYVREYVCE